MTTGELVLPSGEYFLNYSVLDQNRSEAPRIIDKLSQTREVLPKMGPLGPCCDSAGIFPDALLKGEVSRLADGKLSNGLVLELYRFSCRYQLAENNISSWLLRLIPSCKYDDKMLEGSYPRKLRDAVKRLHGERDILRKKKKSSEICVLEEKPFILPSITYPPPEVDVNVMPISMDSKETPSMDNLSQVNEKRTEKGQCRCPKAIMQKNIATLQHRVDNLRAKERTIRNNITKIRYDLNSLKHTQGHYAPHNVNRREARLKKKLKDTEEMCAKLKSENNDLRKAGKSNTERTTDLKRKITNQSKLKWWHKNKKSNKEKETDKEPKTEDLREHVRYLENKIVQLSDHKLITMENGTFTDDTRECVVDFISNEVSSHKVGLIMKGMAFHLYGEDVNIKQLPKRQTVSNIVDEAQYLLKIFYIEKLKQTSKIGLHRDGTMRDHKKIMDTTLTIDEGEVIPLGFSSLSSETAEKIKDCVTAKLEELARFSHEEDFLLKICDKLSYFMTDRAANEKLANKKIEEWCSTIIMAHPGDKREKVNQFFCMAHVLLGFHSYGVKRVISLQRELEAGGTIFGRDESGAFARFGREGVCVRTTRMVSEIIGPCGDGKSGIQDKWKAHCKTHGVKSTIEAYKDNRFNAVFACAVSTLYHKDHILTVIDKIQKPNQKVTSVNMDLKDDKVIAILAAFAVVGIKLTMPYWNMITSSQMHYFDLHEPVQDMYQRISSWIEDIDLLLNREEPAIFRHYPPAEGLKIETVFTLANTPGQKELTSKAAFELLQGMKKTCENQLADFLTGGTYSEPQDRETTHSTLTNLIPERNFGSLESSLQRRRNATLHYHTSVLLLKSKGQELLEWIKHHKDREALWKEARKMGKIIRKERQEQEKKVLEEVNDSLESRSNASKNQMKTVRKKKFADTQEKQQVKQQEKTNKIEVGIWVCVAYHDRWYVGKVVEVGNTIKVDYLQPGRHDGTFKTPLKKDIAEVDERYILKVIPEPRAVSRGRLFRVDLHEDLEEMYENFEWEN